tara:strand:+ start:68 stop:832 length:765 start_codon:yes stop_codon:yes gene_type:complete
MKLLCLKYLSLILILAQKSILFADTLKFVNGSSITGKYIEENTNGVIFQLDGKQQIPQVAVLNELGEMNYLFNKSYIEFVKNDNGEHLFDKNPAYIIGQKYNEDIIWFYSNGIPGIKLKGELISVKVDQDLNPKTGFTSEVIFKPLNEKHVPKLFLGSIINNGEHYIFDLKNIYKILNRTSTDIPMGTYNTTLYSKEFQRNYKNRKDMNSIINANVKDQVNKSESLKKTSNILIIGSCIGFAIYTLFILVSPAG